MKPSPSTDASDAARDGLVAVPNFKVRKQQAVREIIWDAAMDLFVEKGFDETTVDDVAQAAGMSPRSFFRYFASKGDLMAYALLTYGDQLVVAIEACPKSYSPREVLRETVLQVAQEAAAQPRTRKVIEILRKSPAAAAEMSRLDEVQGLVARAFARRLPKGSEDPLIAGVMAGVTLQVTGVMVRWCLEQGHSDISAAMERVLTTFERMFCTTRPPNGRSGQKH